MKTIMMTVLIVACSLLCGCIHEGHKYYYHKIERINETNDGCVVTTVGHYGGNDFCSYRLNYRVPCGKFNVGDTLTLTKQ